MDSKTSDWFEVSLRYRKISEDGREKSVTEQYVVDSISFSEAEERILKEMEQFIRGDYSVKAIKKAAYKEVFFTNDGEGDKWYKAKLQFIIIDENTGKEKRSNVIYLVQSSSLNAVRKSIDEIMDGSLFDYESMSEKKKKILDVFNH